MDSKRVLIVEQDGVRAGATAALVLQAGHLAIGPVRTIEEALKRASSTVVDCALLQREFDDGTDATPIAELLSAAGIPYAFVVEPGDPTKPEQFPSARFLRRPLSARSMEEFLQTGEGHQESAVAGDHDARAWAEIELIKGKIHGTAIRAETKQA
jgi:hypothetical protein